MRYGICSKYCNSHQCNITWSARLRTSCNPAGPCPSYSTAHNYRYITQATAATWLSNAHRSAAARQLVASGQRRIASVASSHPAATTQQPYVPTPSLQHTRTPLLNRPPLPPAGRPPTLIPSAFQHASASPPFIRLSPCSLLHHSGSCSSSSGLAQWRDRWEPTEPCSASATRPRWE